MNWKQNPTKLRLHLASSSLFNLAYLNPLVFQLGVHLRVPIFEGDDFHHSSLHLLNYNVEEYAHVLRYRLTCT